MLCILTFFYLLEQIMDKTVKRLTKKRKKISMEGDLRSQTLKKIALNQLENLLEMVDKYIVGSKKLNCFKNITTTAYRK